MGCSGPECASTLFSWVKILMKNSHRMSCVVQNKERYVAFEVLRAVLINIQDLWVVTTLKTLAVRILPVEKVLRFQNN